MTENQQKVISHTLMQFSADALVTEDEIVKCVDLFSTLNPLTEDEKNRVIRELQSRLKLRIDQGACVRAEDHTPWYNAAKANIDPKFWQRYYLHILQQPSWNIGLLNELDRSTDEIMDMLGNPKLSKGFQRRGLCIGDVQSGKTSNYIGLINKAADAGYRVIILLTGTIEKLRRQTQGRIDKGFIGFDSAEFTRNNKADVRVGVGRIDPSVSGWAVTSTFSDFNTATAQKIVGQLEGIHDPVIFVLKKNKSVLEKLEIWLRTYNANSVTGTIDLPMLLIDDEADNASINTNNPNVDPTAINAGIRKLLRLFDKATYVGFTATPYANIFIDPDSRREMLEDDLFPKHFIYSLEAPSNYIGARDMFREDAHYHQILKSNDDCEQCLPLKHKNGAILNELPDSLKKAIASFFIANAVLDLRGHEKTHRTMMINISRFISIHKQIADKVDEYVREAQVEIRNYFRCGAEALTYRTFRDLKKSFDEHFAPLPKFEFAWEDIQLALKSAVLPITVRAVSGGNASRHLNYDEVDDGLRLIAIGGQSLSRGLTLEGLCVSYFYRNSMFYDTLMQMGRWFGYRSGYDDICQVWMPGSAIGWYSYITEATDELRNEIRRMQMANRTPEDFGLRVRSDKAALLVTARNKMKTASDYEMTVSLSGSVIETPYLHSDAATLQRNMEAASQFLKKLNVNCKLHLDDASLASRMPQYLGVKKEDVVDFLRAYSNHRLDVDFHTDELLSVIRNDNTGVMDRWDVAVATGDGNATAFPGFTAKAVKRGFAIRDEFGGAFQMSGKNSRLGSRGHAKAGLSRDKAVEIEAKAQRIVGRGKQLSQQSYFKTGAARNPLLVIYPVELSVKDDEQDIRKLEAIRRFQHPLIGLSIGIPLIDGKAPERHKYKINLVKYRELFNIDEEGFEESDPTVEE